MTYRINDTTTMVLTDIGDMFTTDPMLIFMADGREVPVYKAFPQILDIDIQDNPIADVLDVTVTNAIGMVSTFTLPDMDAVAAYLMEAAQSPMPTAIIRVTGEPILAAELSEPATEPTDPAPAVQVTYDTTPATDAAENDLQAAMALLHEDGYNLFDADSDLHLSFHIAQRIFGGGDAVSLETIDKTVELLEESDRLAKVAADTKKGKAAADAAANDAYTATSNAFSSLFSDDDLEMMTWYSNGKLTWNSCIKWLRNYQQLILLHHSITNGTCGTLTLTLYPDSEKACLQHEDGTMFTTADVPGYHNPGFNSYITDITVALMAGYRIHVDDNHGDLSGYLADGMRDAIGGYDTFLLDCDDDDEYDAKISVLTADLTTIAANASLTDLLALYLTHNFGSWRTSLYSDGFDAYVHRMAERLRVATTAPAEPVQEAAVDAPTVQVTDDTTQPSEPAQAAPEAATTTATDAVARKAMKRILSVAKALIERCDNYAKLKREGVDDLAEMEYGDIVTMGSSLQLEPVGHMDLEMWDDINARADEAACGRHTPKYYAYVAGEYVKWANGYLTNSTA